MTASQSIYFKQKSLPSADFQLAIILIFLFASWAFFQSFQLEDAFGLSREFVGLETSTTFRQSLLFDSLTTTLFFSTSVVFFIYVISAGFGWHCRTNFAR